MIWFKTILYLRIGMGVQFGMWATITSSLHRLWWKSWPCHAENICLRFLFMDGSSNCAIESTMPVTFWL